VPGPGRVTRPLLDVIEVFLRAFDADVGELHGWAIMKATKRPGPTVYGVLDRLEDLGWITGRWEDQNPEQSKPRRRLYRLTPTGAVSARQILLERRPQALLQPSPKGLRPVLPGWLQAMRQGDVT
jgi:PadR family transcriptional regulator, regulatory protein PadR